MSPDLILFGIQSIIRLKQAGQQALQQTARDQKAIFPDLIKANVSRSDIVIGLFTTSKYKPHIEQSNYAATWEQAKNNDASAIDTLYLLAVQIKSAEGVDLNRVFSQTETAAGLTLVEQWSDSSQPISPIGRFILTSADIALQYVALNPGMLKLGGNGEQLLAALAGNISHLIPDDGNIAKQQFGERLTGIVLKAGLETINAHPDWLSSRQQLQTLITDSTTPLIRAFPDDLNGQLNFKQVLDTLAGPTASVALNTVAANPQAFLGARFTTSKAIGAVTQVVLKSVATDGLPHSFSTAGLITIYSAVLGLAAQQPGLFLDSDDTPRSALITGIFTNLANTLAQNPPPFNGELGTQIAAAMLDAIADNAGRFGGNQQNWQHLAADLLATFAAQIESALTENGNLKNAINHQQLIELARTAVSEIASAPGLINDTNESLEAVIGAVAQAMAADPNLLLSGSDWLQIVKVAAAEAASNPQRLFKLDNNNPKQTLAAQLISMLLHTASGLIDSTPDSRSVLFGGTLREAVTILIKATAGNPAAARANLDKIQTLLTKLNEFIAANPQQFGSKEWLRLYRLLLAGALDGHALPELSVQSANTMLQGVMS